jgi:hypothetical protein
MRLARTGTEATRPRKMMNPERKTTCKLTRKRLLRKSIRLNSMRKNCSS